MNFTYDKEANKLGQLIRAKRKELGMTQSDVAKEIGVCMQHYSRIERGIYIPSLQTFLALSHFLGINAADVEIQVH